MCNCFHGWETSTCRCPLFVISMVHVYVFQNNPTPSLMINTNVSMEVSLITKACTTPSGLATQTISSLHVTAHILWQRTSHCCSNGYFVHILIEASVYVQCTCIIRGDWLSQAQCTQVSACQTPISSELILWIGRGSWDIVKYQMSLSKGQPLWRYCWIKLWPFLRMLCSCCIRFGIPFNINLNNLHEGILSDTCI